MSFTRVEMSCDDQVENTHKLNDFLYNKKISLSDLAREVQTGRYNLESIRRMDSKGSLEVWERIEAYTGLKFKYTPIEKKEKVKTAPKPASKRNTKPSTFIPEHVIPMLKMHGNTVIRNSLVKKHKQEGVLEELKKLGFNNININHTDNDSYILEKG